MAWLGLSDVIPGGRRLAVAVAASFGLLIVAGAAAIVLANQAAEAERWVTHTLEVRRLNQALFVRVQGATLSERGYLITHDARYLAAFEAAKADLPRLEARLRELGGDNAAAQPRIADLNRAILVQVGELDGTIDLLQRGRREPLTRAKRACWPRAKRG